MQTMPMDFLTPFATIAHNHRTDRRVTLYAMTGSSVVWADSDDVPGLAYATDVPLADAPTAWPVDPWDYQAIDD
jgi:hypothetical protein